MRVRLLDRSGRILSARDVTGTASELVLPEFARGERVATTVSNEPEDAAGP